MKHFVGLVLAALLAIAPAFAQAPKGWKVRGDHSADASDPDAAGAIKLVVSGTGFHAPNPLAAVYWNPANTATGNYTLKGTFTLMKPSGHTNYYGLVFGGNDLGGPAQSYLYFMVAQDGTWMIKQRAGYETNDVARSASDAVKKPDATGKSTNVLEVRVMADKVDYLVNGVVVRSTPKNAPTAKTDGMYGLRVNHLLEVQIDGFAVS